MNAVFRVCHIGPVGTVEICAIEIEGDAVPDKGIGALDNFFVVAS